MSFDPLIDRSTPVGQNGLKSIKLNFVHTEICLQPLNQAKQASLIKSQRLLSKRTLIAYHRQVSLLTSSFIIESCRSGA